ncbi:hypothetical protein Hypma_001274 [Hypsizygus marmoreus]|uniref:Uncharacterized protein n=1 Tax=Hypsizygus marmoreus TaxID=39966 RepID=A0A369J8Z7_HYPMA|nr:hypothetical protein Hypma_001274 [Hypsizygus marmoreus]
MIDNAWYMSWLQLDGAKDQLSQHFSIPSIRFIYSLFADLILQIALSNENESSRALIITVDIYWYMLSRAFNMMPHLRITVLHGDADWQRLKGRQRRDITALATDGVHDLYVPSSSIPQF